MKPFVAGEFPMNVRLLLLRASFVCIQEELPQNTR